MASKRRSPNQHIIDSREYAQLFPGSRLPQKGEVRELQHEGKGKLSRATPAIIKAESGQIYLPKSAPWVDEFIGEYVRFKGEGDDHDDHVDVLSYAVQSMRTRTDVQTMIVGTGAPHGWMYGVGRR